MAKDVIISVFEAVKPVIEAAGAELVDVEYKKQYDSMNLTIFIDLPGGVTLDDCERIHNLIDPVLDALDPTGDAPYVLNVSSPGLDRPFKTQRDFERNYEKEVEVKLFAPLKGKKAFEGVLKEKTEHTVTVLAGKEEIKLECSKIALVRPLVKFE